MQFERRVSCPEVFEEVIKIHNEFNETDFEIIETIYDELPLCRVKVTKYKTEDIFSLGYRLSVIEYKMREEGKLGW